MNIYITIDKGSLILPKILEDYKKYTNNNIVFKVDNADLIWMLNFWDLKNYQNFSNIVVDLHHINENKEFLYDYEMINKAKACIVHNEKMFSFLRKKIIIPTYKVPYWVISQRMQPKNIEVVNNILLKINQKRDILIGSFQKDGDGKRGENPKYVKNPDLFINIVKTINKSIKVKVILAGYARGFTIKKLEEENIPYEYFENCNDETLNVLYDCIDYYIVTSRYEGGPQAIVETAYRKTNILSTDVGIAKEVLHPDCICYSIDEFVCKILNKDEHKQYNYESVLKNNMVGNVIEKLDSIFNSVVCKK